MVAVVVGTLVLGTVVVVVGTLDVVVVRTLDVVVVGTLDVVAVEVDAFGVLLYNDMGFGITDAIKLEAVLIAIFDNSFPIRLWDKLLPQVILTLNLLQQSNVAPTVSAYAYIDGPFDYNATPLAPM